MLNALVLEAQPVILDCRGWYLLCITAVGQVYVWDVRKMSALHAPVSLAPVLDMASVAQSQAGHLTNAPSVMFARLNGEGRVVVAMSNGDGFAYNPMMCVWQRLSETWWAVGSQYWNTTDTSTTTASSVASAAKTNGVFDGIKPENISPTTTAELFFSQARKVHAHEEDDAFSQGRPSVAPSEIPSETGVSGGDVEAS